MEIHLNFTASYTLKQRERWVVSYCPELDVASQAESETQAVAALEEAVALYLEPCLERGTLDGALRELAFYIKNLGNRAGLCRSNS